jgi:hypothetical protein
MDEALAKKQEQLANIEEVLEHDGYKILLTEMERLKQKGINDCCDVTKTQTERDAGAGAKKVCEELSEYLNTKAKALRASIGEKKQRTS